MLVLSRKVGEKVVVGNNVIVTILTSRGGKVSLGIDAPYEVPVYREEIRERFATGKSRQDLKVLPSGSRFSPEFA